MLPPSTVATALPLGVLVLGLACSWHDLKSRRIPNRALLLSLGYTAALHALLFLALPPVTALRALGWSVVGLLLGGLLLGPGYAARQVGAGDVKLLMVFGFALGPIGAVFTLLNGALFGGLWALWLSWRHGGLGRLWSNLSLMARTAYASGFRDFGWDLRSAGAVRMPYGVALSAGAGSVALWQLWRSAA